jgi:hypothetical protein
MPPAGVLAKAWKSAADIRFDRTPQTQSAPAQDRGEAGKAPEAPETQRPVMWSRPAQPPATARRVANLPALRPPCSAQCVCAPPKTSTRNWTLQRLCAEEAPPASTPAAPRPITSARRTPGRHRCTTEHINCFEGYCGRCGAFNSRDGAAGDAAPPGAAAVFETLVILLRAEAKDPFGEEGFGDPVRPGLLLDHELFVEKRVERTLNARTSGKSVSAAELVARD